MFSLMHGNNSVQSLIFLLYLVSTQGLLLALYSGLNFEHRGALETTCCSRDQTEVGKVQSKQLNCYTISPAQNEDFEEKPSLISCSKVVDFIVPGNEI